MRQWQNMGIKKGDVVAVQGDKCFLLKAWHACSLLHAVFCPVPSQFKFPSIEPISNERKVLWCSQEGVTKLKQGIFSAWSCLEGLEDAAILFCTSGSMQKSELGPGRWVAYGHKALIEQVQNHANYLRALTCNQRFQLLPFYHAFGLILDVAVGLELNQKIEFVEHDELRSGSWVGRISQDHWDMALTPRLAHLASLKKQASVQGMLHIGGARLSYALRQKLSSYFEHLVEGYGLTECGPGVLMNSKPLGCQVRLQPIESGYGLLQVQSSTMGHWQGKRAELVQGWFNTQDLATMRSDGSYEVIGRCGRHIKHHDGRWILLDSLEDMLEKRYGLISMSIHLDYSGALKVRMIESDAYLWPAIERQLQQQFGLPVVCEQMTELSILQGVAKAVV